MAALNGQEHDNTIAADMAMEGLEYMVAHFLPRHRHCMRDVMKWRMLLRDQEVRSWTVYILWKDFCLFQSISVQKLRHNMEHYLVLGYLRGTTLREHQRYLGTHMRLSL